MGRVYLLFLLGILFWVPSLLAQNNDDLEFEKEIRSMYQEMQERLRRNKELLKHARPEDIYILKNPQDPQSPQSKKDSPSPSPTPQTSPTPETQNSPPLQAQPQKPDLII